MSRFCSFCGKELVDGKCDCTEYINTNTTTQDVESETVANVTDTEYVKAEPTSCTPPVSTPVNTPIGEKPTGILPEILGTLKTFLKSRKEAPNGLSYASMGIFAGAAFVTFVISFLLLFAGSGLGVILDSTFGRSLLMALIIVVYNALVQSGIVVVKKLIKKEPFKVSSEWFNPAAFNTFTYSVITLVASLLSFLSFEISLVFILFASILSIVDAADLITEDKCTWKQAVKYGIVTITSVIFIAIFSKILANGLSLGILSMFM